MSLLSGAKRQNGSALKQSSTIERGAESLEILDKLLGTSSELGAHHSITTDDLSVDFDCGGLSLRELALAEEAEANERAPLSPPVENCACELSPDRFSHHEG